MRGRASLALFVLLAILAACGSPAAPAGSGPAAGSAPGPAPGTPPPAAAPAAPTQPPALQKVDLAMAAISASCGPIWVAIDYGLFRKHGLDVEATSLAAASASQALTSGSVPIAITGGSSVGAWLGGATDLVFIAGLENKATF